LRKPTIEQKRDIRAIAAKRDEDIDFSDAPAVVDWSGAQIGKFYRPTKKPVTMRLDSDIIAWLKADGRGYQRGGENSTGTMGIFAPALTQILAQRFDPFPHKPIPDLRPSGIAFKCRGPTASVHHRQLNQRLALMPAPSTRERFCSVKNEVTIASLGG
jgi:uncharacterized protein (DUF4415 family)